MSKWKPYISDDRKVIELLIRELYGADPVISLRELLQNAHDACLHADAAGYKSGGVTLSVGQNKDYYHVQVSDNGIGMDEKDLQTKLLGVGESNKSDWQELAEDPAALREIVSKRSDVIGKYGVGFLAAFIAAETVEITTRKHGKKENEALSLTCRLGEEHKPEKTSRSAYGTDVRLLIKPDAPGRTAAFREALQKIIFASGLEKEVAKLIYFSSVPVYLEQPGQNKLLTCSYSSPEDIEPDDLHKAIYGDQVGSAEKSNMYKVELGSSGEASYIFLYFWRYANTVSDTTGALTVWVRGMLVEENVRELLPAWADCFTAIMVSPDLPVSLDRRSVVRTSDEFVTLREKLLEVCVEQMQSLVKDDFRKFHRDIWPNMRGVVLPQALRDYSPSRTFANPVDKAGAEQFLKKIGPLLPLSVIHSNVERGGSHKHIFHMEELRSRLEADEETGACTIQYLTTSGTVDTTLDREWVVDARAAAMQGKRNDETVALMTAVSNLLSDRFSVEEYNPMVGLELSPEEYRIGWEKLELMIRGLARYVGADGRPEQYEIHTRKYRPTFLSAVGMEFTPDETESQRAATAVERMSDQFPGLKSLFADLKGRVSAGERVLTLIINADNDLMKALAAIFAGDDKRLADPRLAMLLKNIVEDARVDFYGGAYIGSEAQEGVYARTRIPTYLEFLELVKNDIEAESRVGEVKQEREQQREASEALRVELVDAHQRFDAELAKAQKDMDEAKGKADAARKTIEHERDKLRIQLKQNAAELKRVGDVGKLLNSNTNIACVLSCNEDSVVKKCIAPAAKEANFDFINLSNEQGGAEKARRRINVIRESGVLFIDVSEVGKREDVMFDIGVARGLGKERQTVLLRRADVELPQHLEAFDKIAVYGDDDNLTLGNNVQKLLGDIKSDLLASDGPTKAPAANVETSLPLKNTG